jgi:hypothetical protein
MVIATPALAPAQARPAVESLAAGAWQFETDTHAALEAWNYNGSHEELYGLAEGLTYGVRDGVMLVFSQRFYYVSQRANDAVVLGLTFGFRRRVYRRGCVSGFVEGDVGISDAAIAAPPRGTRFNYLALASGGVLVRVRPRVQLLAGLELTHLSNASLKGPGRNPDIEAVGLRTGLVIPF